MDAIGPNEDIAFDGLLIVYPYDDFAWGCLDVFDGMLDSRSRKLDSSIFKTLSRGW